MNKMLIMAAVLIGGCCGGSPHEYPKQDVDRFVSECMQSGGTMEECRCSIERIQALWRYDDFKRADRDNLPIPPEVDRAVQTCTGRGR